MIVGAIYGAAGWFVSDVEKIFSRLVSWIQAGSRQQRKLGEKGGACLQTCTQHFVFGTLVSLFLGVAVWCQF